MKKSRCFLVFLFFSSLTIIAQSNMYMLIADIPGDVTVNKYEKQIEISSLNFDITKSNPRGDAELMPIIVEKNLDISTSELMNTLATGKILPKVEISFVKATGSGISTRGGELYLKYELKNVTLTNYSVSSEQDEDHVRESMSLYFNEITVTQWKINHKTGKPEEIDEFTWKRERRQ